ncbi:hypothetical protein DSO57_1028400 [Entomophthora muscae]|uniref:Uncharacterized protein n=1 Tax=Entomophthora muscae TaxID=34485 RepID=A0ACC2SQU2_9FUNG|nr:hypothetical protein DSO57_1028400 [Entomophthora muscae]
MTTLPLSNDEALAYLLLGALLVLFFLLAVQLTRLYTASTANPQPTTNASHTVLGNLHYLVYTITYWYYPNHGLKEWSDLYEKANFPDVNQMLSITQVTLGPYYYLIMGASCMFMLIISAYYIYQYNSQTMPELYQTRPEREAYIKHELEPSCMLTPKTMLSACYPGSLSKPLSSWSSDMTTRSSFEPLLLSEPQASSQVSDSKTKKTYVSCISFKQYHATCIPKQQIYIGAMETVKNFEMAPTEKSPPSKLPSPLVTKPKSIYRLKSDAIKEAIKAAELRISQGLLLDNCCSLNHWFSEIESQERMKKKSQLAPTKSVDPSIKSGPDSTPENKKTDFPYSVMTTSVSTIQSLSHMLVSSHHQGYTILLSASKEHKNDGSPYKVDDVYTRPHQPERIPVELKTRDRPRDSCRRTRIYKKLQPQEYRPQKAIPERPDGHKKKTKEHQESISLVEPKAPGRDQTSAKSFPGLANSLPKPENVVSKGSQTNNPHPKDSKAPENFSSFNHFMMLPEKILEGDEDNLHTEKYPEILPKAKEFDSQLCPKHSRDSRPEISVHDISKSSRACSESPKIQKQVPDDSEGCHEIKTEESKEIDWNPSCDTKLKPKSATGKNKDNPIQFIIEDSWSPVKEYNINQLNLHIQLNKYPPDNHVKNQAVSGPEKFKLRKRTSRNPNFQVQIKAANNKPANTAKSKDTTIPPGQVKYGTQIQLQDENVFEVILEALYDQHEALISSDRGLVNISSRYSGTDLLESTWDKLTIEGDSVMNRHDIIIYKNCVLTT